MSERAIRRCDASLSTNLKSCASTILLNRREAVERMSFGSPVDFRNEQRNVAASTPDCLSLTFIQSIIEKKESKK